MSQLTESLRCSIPFATSAAFLVWVTYLCYLAVYRLYFHPLAKFPGPKYAAISRWHEFYYEVILKGKFTFKIQDYHKKYGPIVRIVPDELHIKDPTFYDTLYTKAGRVDRYEWTAGRFNAPGSSFSTSSADLHALRRGALNPLFSRARIIDFEYLVREKVDRLAQRIREFSKTGEPFSISGAFHSLAGDVVMQYCFGFCYDQLDSADFSGTFYEAFMASSIASHLSLQFPIVPKILFSLPDSLLVKIEPVFALLFRMQKDLNRRIIAEKKGQGDGDQKEGPPTIIRKLLENTHLPEREKETKRLQDEVQVLLGAGVTTTSWALSVATFYLTESPKTYGKLRAELEQAIPDPTAELHWAQLEKLPYLTGCIHEALRLSYPVSARSPRLISHALQYKEWTIPPRTPVSMTMFDFNDDEDIYPQSKKFLPERWLDSPKTSDGSSLDRYFIPFHKGTRSCLGINLAYAELYLAMATVFRNFKFELHETDITDIEIVSDFFIPAPKPDSKGIRVKCVAAS